MRKRVQSLAVVALLMYPATSLAAGNDPHNSHDMPGMNHTSDMPGMSQEEHQKMTGGNQNNMPGMDMSGTDGHQMDSHQPGGGAPALGAHGHDSEGSGHSHGNVVETPPNYTVLGSFGAVNAGFILYGAFAKWFRKRGI